MARLPIQTLEDVAARCDEIGDCLIWRGAVTEEGCPKAVIAGKCWNVRNFIFTELLGKDLHGHVVVPRCGNPACLAEDCLRRVTVSQFRKQSAAREMLTPGGKLRRQRRMVAAGIARLNPDIAAEIRASEKTSKEWAEELGVHIRSIQRIRKRESWAPHSTPTSVFNLGG